MEKKEMVDQINYLKELAEYTRVRAADGYQFFLLWGVLWIIGYIGSIYFTYIVWAIIGPVGGILSAWLGYRVNRGRPAPLLLKKIGWLALSLLFFSSVLAIAFGFLGNESQHLQKFFNAYWPFIIGVIYTSAGIFMDKNMVRVGIWLLIMSVVGFFLPLIYQEVYFAIIGGGSIIISGLVLRKKVLKNG